MSVCPCPCSCSRCNVLLADLPILLLIRYQQLLNQLRPDEWREVQARTTIQLKCDILGSLPLELVAQIVKFLSISEIISLQRVIYIYACVKLSTNYLI